MYEETKAIDFSSIHSITGIYPKKKKEGREPDQHPHKHVDHWPIMVIAIHKVHI